MYAFNQATIDAEVVEKFLNGLYYSFLGPTVVRMHQKLFKNSSLTLLWSHKESYLQLLKKGLLTKNRLYLQNLEMLLWNKEAAPNWEKVVKFSVKRQMYCSKMKKVNKMIVVWVVSKIILYKSRLELHYLT